MELPPPVMKQQVRNLSVHQDIQVLRGGTASEAFGPRSAALQALREFMDAERIKARRRIQILCAVLAGVLVLILAAGVWGGIRLSRQASQQASVLQANLEETRKDVQAVRREVETRWNTWESESAALQKSLGEAQQNLTALREQLASALKGASGGSSPVVALLQEIQVFRAEQLDLEAQQSFLQNEMTQLEAGQKAREVRRAHLLEERSALAKAVEDFASRQQDAEARLQQARETAVPSVDAKAVVGRSRKAAPEKPQDTSAALAVLEDLYRLRSEHLDLTARQAMLQKELDDLDGEERFGQLRQQRAEQSRADLAAKVASYLARQQELQARLQSLRTEAPTSENDLIPDLIK